MRTWRASDTQLSLSYWNDNVFFQKQLASVRPMGDDDFMTASFRFQLAHAVNDHWVSLESYYAIFTDRVGNYRFDIFSLRRTVEIQSTFIKWKLGYGGVVRGDLGGDRIQNVYHHLRGYSRVALPQLDGYRFGFTGLIKASHPVDILPALQLEPYVSSVLRVGAGPTGVRAGVESTTPWVLPNLRAQGSLQLRLGYVNYLLAHTLIEPAFDQGVVFGIMWNTILDDHWGLSLWYTENQYGLDDPHYGMTLHHRPDGVRFGGLGAVMFP